MTDQAHTPVPKSGSGAMIGWTAVVILMVIGMVVAFFLLNAGKVYVVSSEQSYTEYESDLASMDIWLPADLEQTRQLIHEGAIVDEHQIISTDADLKSLVDNASEASCPAAIRAEIGKELSKGKSIKMVRLTGTATRTTWLPTGEDAADSELPALGMSLGTLQWTATGEVSTWKVTKELPNHLTAEQRKAEGGSLSTSRTIGIWLAAILTLAIMSFLFGDNVFYKTAEAILVGSSAGYAMAYAFYTGIVDQLMVNLFPSLVREWTSPGLPWSFEWDWVYVIPAILAVMLVCRLLPKGGWIARWPLAFIIGATAGFRLTSHLESDFLLQIKQTITTLWAENANGQFDFWGSTGAVVILVGVLLCLVYFFFSLEHKGAVGKAARGGIFVLMITFGAAFGLTVMGRITLLTERFDFLFKEWLHLM